MNVYVITEVAKGEQPVVKVFSSKERADAYVTWRSAQSEAPPAFIATTVKMDEEPGEVKLTVWLVAHNGNYLRSRVATLSHLAWRNVQTDKEQLDALCRLYLRHEDPAEVVGAYVFDGTKPVHYFSQRRT